MITKQTRADLVKFITVYKQIDITSTIIMESVGL